MKEDEDLGNINDDVDVTDAEIVEDGLSLPQGEKSLENDDRPAIGGEQQPQGRTQHIPDEALRIATFGTMPYVEVLPHMITGKRFAFRNFTNIDELIEWKPSITFICTEMEMKANGLQNDDEFIANIQKIERNNGGGICIKSVVSPDTMGRVLMSLSGETINKRIVYNPEMCDSSDLKEMINNTERHLVAGTPDAVGAHMQFFNMTSLYTFTGVVQVGLMEGVLIKLAQCAYRAVKQTFFNQLLDVTNEYGVSPAVIRKSTEAIRDDLSDSVATVIRAQMDDVTFKKAKSFGGEYDNYDVGVFVGMTDKMPLLDECVNYRNLKKES